MVQRNLGADFYCEGKLPEASEEDLHQNTFLKLL